MFSVFELCPTDRVRVRVRVEWVGSRWVPRVSPTTRQLGKGVKGNALADARQR